MERPACGSHLVQFYGADERTLMRNVSQYVAEGLGRGDRVLIVASQKRAEPFLQQLDALQAGPSQALAENRLIVADANLLLDRFLVDAQPNWKLFDLSVGEMVRELNSRAGSAGLRAYGEMVDILWNRGMQSAAIQLEAFWNRLLTTYSFSLYCAYSVDVFAEGFHPKQVGALLASHTHLLPTGADGALQEALDRAMEEVLGGDLAETRRSIGQEPVNGHSLMPAAEASILWLREQRPEAARAIMRIASELYGAHARSSRSTMWISV